MQHGDTSEARYYQDLDSWVIAGRTAGQTALGHAGLSSRTGEAGSYLPTDMRAECSELIDVLSRWFVLLDGDEHVVARRGVQRMFSPGRIRRIQDTIHLIVDEAVGNFPLAGGDAMPQLAEVISARTMAFMLGLEKGDAHQLHRWARAIADFLAKSYRRDYALAAQQAMRDMAVFIKSSNRVDAIWNLTEGDDRDRMATCSLMLFGGLETTAALMGFSLWYVLENKLTDMVADPERARETQAVVERVLELHPPLGHVARTSVSDVTIDGEDIPPGKLVMVSLTGEDPLVAPVCPMKPAPHVDTPQRNEHLAFGFGMHYCMGAPLARLEAAALLSRFAARFPGARVSDVSWSRNRTYRSFDHLYIDTGAG
jgi:cytochrome P450